MTALPLRLLLSSCALGLLLAAPATAADPVKKNPDEVRVTPEQMHQIEVTPAKPRSFHQQKAAIGQIAFNEDATTTVQTPFSGRVTRVLARPGDQVERGAPLFEIDSPEVMQAHTDLIAALQGVEKQKAQLGLAKRVVDRLSSLLAGNATSQRELDQARTDMVSAESDLAAANSALTAARNKLRVILGVGDAEIEKIEKTRQTRSLITVNAPIDGTVIGRKIGPGQYVRTDVADPLFTLADLSTMWLKAYVAESDIAFVREGQELEVRVAALPDRVFTARVTSIAAASDPQTRRIIVRSEIANPDRVLRAEMFATFKIAVGEAESGLALPSRSIIREGDKMSVWVESGPQTFRRREIKAGLESDGEVIIREGLKPGEKGISRGAIFVDNEAKQ